MHSHHFAKRGVAAVATRGGLTNTNNTSQKKGNTKGPPTRTEMRALVKNSRASSSKNCKLRSKEQSKGTNKHTSSSSSGKAKKTSTKNTYGRRSKQ